MVAYNFQQDFGPDILAGCKQSTIRPNGKRRHAVAGDELQLYTGMRTSDCRLLLRVPCLWSRPISIHQFAVVRQGGFTNQFRHLEELARIEGFASWADMRDWFGNRYGLPAVGFTQIRWDFSAATFVADSAAAGGSAP
ncbi:ASCH domain-containing protein [Leisingera sp. NJS201]|uniref:ASCH domain-containing protein n=1 Tax=Leisingera sp. NJS201 TaxID=2508306 RepID=UPI0010712809|nr:ASCH domain-containing protein [Leisingera sp. NJS201]QBR35737.1 ASCH domain-containing protein [Leisingera sp. NJS201]